MYEKPTISRNKPLMNNHMLKIQLINNSKTNGNYLDMIIISFPGNSCQQKYITVHALSSRAQNYPNEELERSRASVRRRCRDTLALEDVPTARRILMWGVIKAQSRLDSSDANFPPHAANWQPAPCRRFPLCPSLSLWLAFCGGICQTNRLSSKTFALFAIGKRKRAFNILIAYLHFYFIAPAQLNEITVHYDDSGLTVMFARFYIYKSVRRCCCACFSVRERRKVRRSDSVVFAAFDIVVTTFLPRLGLLCVFFSYRFI